MANILSLDIEEFFHIEYAKNSRVERVFRTGFILPQILDLLDEYRTKATFFVVGEIAEKCPEVVEKISRRGHEIAFHSYDHERLCYKKQEQFELEFNKFNELLESKTGHRCLGFRAPSFSVSKKTAWLYPTLEKLGVLYDSSVFPCWTPLYGSFNLPMKPYQPLKTDIDLSNKKAGLWEFPANVFSISGLRFPAAGGFYLRTMPHITRRAIKQKNKQGLPAVIFVHSWELDGRLPKPKLGLFKSFVTYHGLSKMFELIKSLLNDFEFTSFHEYMKSEEML